MRLRPYQADAVKAIFNEWSEKRTKTLLVLATGLGKTIVFCKVIEKLVANGKRVLILAHRGELLDQASDKLKKTTGLDTALEKAGSSCLEMPQKVVVGSVQTLQSEKRLSAFAPDYFDVIVIDEAHHALSESYQRVLNHFPNALVLGVTATPDRGDKKNLGKCFDSIAFEYNIAQGIKDGYLSPIRAQMIPLKIDLSNVKTSAGDYAAGDLGTALDPYLELIGEEMANRCKGRKTIVFLPLVATSRRFKEILQSHGFQAEEISGQDAPEIRSKKLADFEAGKIDVLCNSMLLTEGFDCPSIDCVVCLRPTKVRSLYTQIIGRGTRLHPGKDHLLVLDFLWQTQSMELCHPCHLITDDKAVANRMTEILAEKADDPEQLMFDIEELEVLAKEDVIAQREAALAQQLAQMRSRKAKYVDPLQWELSINSNDLADYEETMPWEFKPITQRQKQALEKWGLSTVGIDTSGKAALILNKLIKRREAGLATPKQIRLLERKGFRKVGEWSFQAASHMIGQLANNGWSVPRGIQPAAYKPQIQSWNEGDWI